MNKTASFVRLEFITVKPYFAIRNLLIYAAVALFLTTVSGNITSGVGFGMMLGTMFASYPFVLADKSNLDALYVTLSVSRKTVVLGRYLFTLALDVCAIACSLVLSAAGVFAVRAFASDPGASDTRWATLVLAAVFIAVQAVQLPIYFKFGYAKAKFFSLLPFCFVMAAVAALVEISKGDGLPGASALFGRAALGDGAIIPAACAALLLIIFASYRLSLSFYRKRAF
ncbi:MAG: ABC-2 transporter permease [Clostridiales Family XIII bacterium]|jgi:hypothetical protein|nr:ABC-2 transporter permease [Clostridiales Family XIII bacterium]